MNPFSFNKNSIIYCYLLLLIFNYTYTVLYVSLNISAQRPSIEIRFEIVIARETLVHILRKCLTLLVYLRMRNITWDLNTNLFSCHQKYGKIFFLSIFDSLTKFLNLKLTDIQANKFFNFANNSDLIDFP